MIMEACCCCVVIPGCLLATPGQAQFHGSLAQFHDLKVTLSVWSRHTRQLSSNELEVSSVLRADMGRAVQPFTLSLRGEVDIELEGNFSWENLPEFTQASGVAAATRFQRSF